MPAYGGYSIARDEKVIFIKGAIPGEVVEVEIQEKKRDYAIARALKVVEPSEHRVAPICPVFGLCGGCQLQFIAYEKQLEMKDEILSDSLTRLAGLDVALSPAVSDSQWHYRRRCQFKVSPNGELGFFRSSSRDVVTFECCPLMIQEINEIIGKTSGTGVFRGLTEVHISVGNSTVALIKGRDYDICQPEQYKEIGFDGIEYNDKVGSGTTHTELDLNGLKYSVSPQTFFQAHWSLNRKVLESIINHHMPLQGKRILDLYAGAGNLSLPMAANAGEVVAIEENEHAVEDGYRNLELNKLKNCRFIKSTAEKYRLKNKFDIIMLDPPRPGLTSEVIRKILDNPSDAIIYMSCNPATLARDLKKLKEKYEINSIRQIDFFPNTFHIESLAFLQIRK
jgi:23S rRNA (uracil1939-C5)-methyltransferase